MNWHGRCTGTQTRGHLPHGVPRGFVLLAAASRPVNLAGSWSGGGWGVLVGSSRHLERFASRGSVEHSSSWTGPHRHNNDSNGREKDAAADCAARTLVASGASDSCSSLRISMCWCSCCLCLLISASAIRPGLVALLFLAELVDTSSIISSFDRLTVLDVVVLATILTPAYLTTIFFFHLQP